MQHPRKIECSWAAVAVKPLPDVTVVFAAQELSQLVFRYIANFQKSEQQVFTTSVGGIDRRSSPRGILTLHEIPIRDIGIVRDVSRWILEFAFERESQYGDFYQLGLMTGMRRGELAGLKWANVNLANQQLQVVNTLQRITGQGLMNGQPKTERSRRSIALSVDTVALLHEIRGRQITQQLEVSDAWTDSGYVFTDALVCL